MPRSGCQSPSAADRPLVRLVFHYSSRDVQRRVVAQVLSSAEFQRLVRSLFDKGRIQSEADLRWRVAWILESVIAKNPRIGNWHVHTEVPFRVTVRGQVTMRRPDVVVSTDLGGKVKAAVEIKVFQRKPERQHLIKDSDTLRALSSLPFVETGCLLYVYPSGGEPEPAFRTEARWASDFLLHVPLPMPEECIENYFRPWKWQ